MGYENRENGGMSQGQIERELQEYDKKYDFLEGAKILIKKMIDGIKSDPNIPYRLTKGEKGGLHELSKQIDQIQAREMAEGKTLEDCRNLGIWAKRINEAEDKMLADLLSKGSIRNLAHTLSRSHIDCEIIEQDNSVKLTNLNGNTKISDITHLFNNYNFEESYEDADTGETYNFLTTNHVINTNKTYRLDYSHCSEAIKNKVRNIVANGTLDDVEVLGSKGHNKNLTPITKETDLHNFVFEINIMDFEGKLGDFPLGEGLIITDKISYRGKTEMDHLQAQQNLENEILSSISLTPDELKENPGSNPKTQHLVEFFGTTNDEITGNKLRLKLVNSGNENYNKFLIETENRVREIVRILRKKGYTNPTIKDGIIFYRDNEHREGKIPLRNSDGESYNNYPNAPKLGKDLYEIVDDYGKLYDEYLTISVMEKWVNTEPLAKEKQVIKSHQNTSDIDNNDLLFQNSPETLAYIYAFQEILKITKNYNCNDGENLNKVNELLENSILNLQKGSYFSNKEIREVINQIGNILPNLSKSFILQKPTELVKKCYNNLFIEANNTNPNYEKMRTLCRELSEYFGYSGNIDQGNEIMQVRSREGTRTIKIGNNPDEQKKYKNLNEGLQKIDELLELKNPKFDNEGNLIPNEQTKLIDELYAISESDNKIINLNVRLTRNKIMPEKFHEIIGFDKIQEILKTILNNLEKRKKDIENSCSYEKIRTNLAQQRKDLSQSNNDNDKAILQNLDIFFRSSQDEQDRIIKTIIEKNKNILKYQGINDEIFFPLCKGYAEYAGGTNNYTLNNIYGFGWCFSDYTNMIMTEITEGVLLTIVTRYIGGGMIKGIKSSIKIGNVISAMKNLRTTTKIAKMFESGSNLVTSITNCAAKLGPRLSRVASKGKEIVKSGFSEFLEDFGGNSLKDFSVSIRRGENPFQNFIDNIGDNRIEGFKAVATMGLFKSVKLTRNLPGKLAGKVNINYKPVLEKIPLEIKQQFFYSGLGPVFNEMLAQPPMNLIFGKKDPKSGQYEHKFDFDDYMLGNLITKVLSKNKTISRYVGGSLGLSDFEYETLCNTGFSYYCDEQDKKIYIQDTDTCESVPLDDDKLVAGLISKKNKKKEERTA